MELPDTTEFVVVRGEGEPVGMVSGGPACAEMRSDGQRAELVEREHPVRGHATDVFDTGEFRSLICLF
jgi:hypothetical protein